MKRVIGCLVLLLAGVSLAHIKLDEPTAVVMTDMLGNPQKTEPCGGAGTATNAVRTVEAGSMLTVSWRETILHPGHFRLAIAPDAGSFVTPTAVLNAGGTNCASAPIEANPRWPVLVDGLFVHSAARPGGMYSTQIRVPDVPCDRCTLQLLQFMSAHAPSCWYYQCATLRIVAPDAGVRDAGMPDSGVAVDAGRADAGTADAGVEVDAGGAGAGGSGAGGTTGDAGVLGQGGSPGAGGSAGETHSHDAGIQPVDPPMGCGCQSAECVAVLALGLLRRRTRR